MQRLPQPSTPSDGIMLFPAMVDVFAPKTSTITGVPAPHKPKGYDRRRGNLGGASPNPVADGEIR
jgi:hypothetical protein